MAGEVKHTPGPWDVDGKAIVGRKGRRIISDYGAYEGLAWGDAVNGMADDEIEANKTLIAGAPELLEALQLVVTRCGPNSSDGAMARAAIARATGNK